MPRASVPALREAGIARGGKDFAETFSDVPRLVIAQAQEKRGQLSRLKTDHGMAVLVETDIDGGRGDVDDFPLDRLVVIRQLPHELFGQRLVIFLVAIALIDFDDLKRVNDSLGHQTGDRVLVEMARLLNLSTRRVDRVGRSGGDEFLILLPETPMQGAVICLELIRNKVENYPFLPDGDGHLPLTISVGIASCPDPGVQGPEELIRRADVAMYSAKHSGRNRIFPFAQG